MLSCLLLSGSLNCRQVQLPYIHSHETSRNPTRADQRLLVIGTTSVYGMHVFIFFLYSKGISFTISGGLSFQAINIPSMAPVCLYCHSACLFGHFNLCCEARLKNHGGCSSMALQKFKRMLIKNTSKQIISLDT